MLGHDITMMVSGIQHGTDAPNTVLAEGHGRLIHHYERTQVCTLQVAATEMSSQRFGPKGLTSARGATMDQQQRLRWPQGAPFHSTQGESVDR